MENDLKNLFSGELLKGSIWMYM